MFLYSLSKELTGDRNKQHDLAQEVILQIAEIDPKRLEQMKHEDNLEGFCAKILVRNYRSLTSNFNYQEIRRKSICPYSIDEPGFHDYYRERNTGYSTVPEEKNRQLSEYDWQKIILSMMQSDNRFRAADINLMKEYFLSGYNLNEFFKDLKEDGLPISYGWIHKRLKSVKEKIPAKLKEQWKG